MVSPINDGLLGEGGGELIGSQLPLEDLILAARTVQMDAVLRR